MMSRNMVPVLVLAALPFAAEAHDGMHGPGAEFDANVDGALSLPEFRNTPLAADKSEEEIAALFAELDLDDDRFLVSAEYLRGLAQAE